MKSICLVVQSHYDVDARVRRKAEALAAAGYIVDVLALRLPNGQKDYAVNGVNVHTIKLGKQRGSLARYAFEYVAFFLWVSVQVALRMRHRRYVVIDVNTLPDFLIFAPIAARWMGALLILDMHEITPEFYISKYGIADNSWVLRLLKYLEKISFNFADKVITINEPIQTLLERRGLAPSKSTVIMNAADEARFASSPSRSFAAAAAADPSKFVMVYHGTLTRIYGLDIAVEAFSIAHSAMANAEFWILGSGPEEGALAQLVQRHGLSEKVKLIGQVPSAEIPSWLDRCDVGVLPIRRDVFLEFAFPNKLPEFIITGKAVIISRLKTIQHYFSDDALSYFEPNNPVDLAAQMVRLYKDHGLRTRLAATAKEEYSPIRWDLMRQRYLRLIDEMSGSGCHTAERPPAAETTTARG